MQATPHAQWHRDGGAMPSVNWMTTRRRTPRAAALCPLRWRVVWLEWRPRPPVATATEAVAGADRGMYWAGGGTERAGRTLRTYAPQARSSGEPRVRRRDVSALGEAAAAAAACFPPIWWNTIPRKRVGRRGIDRRKELEQRTPRNWRGLVWADGAVVRHTRLCAPSMPKPADWEWNEDIIRRWATWSRRYRRAPAARTARCVQGM